MQMEVLDWIEDLYEFEYVLTLEGRDLDRWFGVSHPDTPHRPFRCEVLISPLEWRHMVRLHCACGQTRVEGASVVVDTVGKVQARAWESLCVDARYQPLLETLRVPDDVGSLVVRSEGSGHPSRLPQSALNFPSALVQFLLANLQPSR